MEREADAYPLGKLGDPQTLNLYTYVTNHPLSLVDPVGHYECLGSVCDQLRIALSRLSALATSQRLTRAEKDMVTAAVRLYGKEGEKNGVVVTSGDKNAAQMKDGVITITLNLKAKDTEANVSTGKQVTREQAEVEKAAVVAHEGDHGVRYLVHDRMPMTRTEAFSAEQEAYRVEGTVNKAANVDSAIGVWTSGGGYSQERIDQGARLSVENSKIPREIAQ